MIELKNVCKSYNDEPVLNKLNLSIKGPCFITITGPSGCGKSTLLNIISLMDNNFQGDYYFEGININELSSEEKEKIRTNKITYLFQEAKIIENESVLENLRLMTNLELDEKIVLDYLKKYSLEVNINSKVGTLSKGEQKRLSLIGLELRETPLIICDEITSGLDEKNAKQVLALLKKLGKTKIVILVTHDVRLVKKYCSSIKEIKQGSLPRIIISKKEINDSHLDKNNKLPLSYMIKHLKTLIKAKKVRVLLLLSSMIICLFTMGLSLLISDQVEHSLIKSFNSLFSSNQIVMERKDNEEIVQKMEVLDKNEFSDFYDNYNDLIVSNYSFYKANFEDYFKDENYLAINLENSYFNIEGYGIREFVNYFPFHQLEEEIYPNNSICNGNKIIIALSNVKIRDICIKLNLQGITKDYLSNYLERNTIPLSLFIRNEEWEYNIEINFEIVGFVVSNEKYIVSNSDNFNEYLVEEIMQLPYSYSLLESDYYPWTVKKINAFVILEENVIPFFERMTLDEKMDKYSFHLVNDDSMDIFNKKLKVKLGYLTFKNDKYINLSLLEKIVNNHEEIISYLPCGNNTYSLDTSTLLNGFSFPTYLSSNKQIIEEFNEYNYFSSLSLGNYQSAILNSNFNDLYPLGFLDSSKENFIKFHGYNKKNLFLLEGDYPSSYNEILVSSSLYKELNLSKENDMIYITFLKEIKKLNEGHENVFETLKFKVVGRVDDENKKIYHNHLFPQVITTCKLNLDYVDLEISNVLLTLNKNDKNLLKRLNMEYGDYNFYNPLEEYYSNVNEGLSYISMGLFFFSLISLISSLCMMILVNYLFISETKKELAIYSFLGYKNNSIKKFYYFLSGILSLISVLLTLISLFFVLMTLPFFNSFFTDFYISYKPFLIIIIVALSTFLITNFITLKSIDKLDVIDLIKR